MVLSNLPFKIIIVNFQVKRTTNKMIPLKQFQFTIQRRELYNDFFIIRDLFWTNYINPVLILIATYFGLEQIDHLY